MSGFQKIIITGNLGQTPEGRETRDGDYVVNLSVAVNRVYRQRDSDDLIEEVTWYRVPLWGDQAEDAEKYLIQGQEVTVCGRLIPDEFGNCPIWYGDDDEPRASFEIFPTERVVYGPKPSGDSGSRRRRRDDDDDDGDRKSSNRRSSGRKSSSRKSSGRSKSSSRRSSGTRSSAQRSRRRRNNDDDGDEGESTRWGNLD